MKKTICKLTLCAIACTGILCGCAANASNNSSVIENESIIESNSTIESESMETKETVKATAENTSNLDEIDFSKVTWISREDAETYLADAQRRAAGTEQDETTEDDAFQCSFLQDKDFILAMYPVDASMQKTYYLVIRSTDGGKTWNMDPDVFTANGINDIEIADTYVVITHGSRISPSVMISDDYGKTFTEVCMWDILPEYDASFEGFEDCITGQISEIDRESKTIEINWYDPDDKKQIQSPTLFTLFDQELNLLEAYSLK